MQKQVANMPLCSTATHSKMTKQLDNLERLCNKLQRRYGRGDPLCVQVQADLDAKKANEFIARPHHDWSVTYRTLLAQHRIGH
jgi:predicted deacetylase